MEINPIIKVPPPEYRQAPLASSQKSRSMMLLVILGGLLVLGAAGAAYFFLYAQDDANANNENLVVANQNREANSNTQPPQNLNVNTAANQNTNSGVIVLNTNAAANTNQSPSNTNSINIAVDEDEDGLNELLEGYYGTSDLKSDFDGDSYTDYDEVKNCYNPIQFGKIDDRYFSDTFCINIWAGNLSLNDKPALRQEMLDMCRQWKPFAKAYLEALDAGDDPVDLLETDNIVYRSSCSLTEDYLETADILDEMEALTPEAVSAADICDAIAYTAAYVCAQKLNPEIPPITLE